MQLENKHQLKMLARWIIGIFTSCILIYLFIRHFYAVIDAFFWLIDLFCPLLWSIALAFIFNVPLRAIEEPLKLPRPLALFLSFFLIFGILLGLILLIAPSFNAFAELFCQFVDKDGNFKFSCLPFCHWLENYSIPLPDFNLFAYSLSFADTFSCFLIGLAISIYLLYHKETLKKQSRHLLMVWFPKSFSLGLVHIFSVFSLHFQQFIVAQAIEAFLLGLLCLLGMLLFRLPYPVIISSFVGVTALIPIAGAILGASLGALLLYTISPYKALFFLIFIFFLQQLEGDILYPKVVGKKIKLPPIWVLIAITLGGRLCGLIGMFFGVPFCSALYALLKEATQKRESAL